MKKDEIEMVKIFPEKDKLPSAPKPMSAPPSRKKDSLQDFKDGYKAGFADGYREGMCKQYPPVKKMKFEKFSLCRGCPGQGR